MCPVYQGVLIKGLHCTINRAFCLMYIQTGHCTEKTDIFGSQICPSFQCDLNKWLHFMCPDKCVQWTDLSQLNRSINY